MCLASHRIPARPFEAFGENAGITLPCEFTPAGESIWEIDHTHTSADGEVFEGEGNGIATVPPQTDPRDDGDGGEYEYLTYYEDGTLATTVWQTVERYCETHYDEMGNRVTELTVYPNGYCSNSTYYANGSVESSVSYWGRCYLEDYYRENGSRISSYWKDSDSEIKWTFDENDEMAAYEEAFADGAWCLYTYENGKHVLSKGYGSDGLYWENQYDENGNLIKTIREVSPGKFVEDIIEPTE